MISANMFPESWPVKPLGEIVEFLDHKRIPIKADERTEGEYAYYGANGLQGYINGYIFDEPLVLLAEDGGHFGDPNRTIAYIAAGKYWVNNHAHVIKPKNGLDLNYLCRVLEKYDVTPFIKGATREKLSKTDASRIPIPYPPLETQKQIAAALERADQLCKDCRRVEQELNALAQSVFLEMFGDPVKNAKAFPVQPLSEVASVDRGKFSVRPRNDPRYYGGDHPFIQTGDVVKSETYIREHTQSLNDAGLRVSKAFEPGTIAITIAANIGETAILTYKMCFPDSVVGIVVGKCIVPEFLEYQLRFFKPLLNRAATETAQKNINLQNLRPLKVIVPDLEKQNKFLAVIKSIDQHKKELRVKLILSEQLFRSLLQRAFKGDLDFKEMRKAA